VVEDKASYNKEEDKAFGRMDLTCMTDFDLS